MIQSTIYAVNKEKTARRYQYDTHPTRIELSVLPTNHASPINISGPIVTVVEGTGCLKMGVEGTGCLKMLLGAVEADKSIVSLQVPAS